ARRPLGRPRATAALDHRGADRGHGLAGADHGGHAQHPGEGGTLRAAQVARAAGARAGGGAPAVAPLRRRPGAAAGAALAALAGAGHPPRPVRAAAGDADERLDRERLLGIPAALVRPVPGAAADRRRRSPVRPPPRRARMAVLAAAGAGAGACLRRGLAPPVPGRRHAVADAAARLAEAARPHARGDPLMRVPFLAATLLVAGTLAAAPA